MPTQLIKLTLIDASPIENDSAPDTETFSIYQEGAQDASRQVLSIEATSVEVENRRELFESKTYTIDVVGLYSQSKRTKVQGWSKNATPLFITGYALDGTYLYAYGAITLLEGFGDNTSFRFRFQSEARGNYDPNTSAHSSYISYDKNALAYWKWEENPVNSSNTPISADARLLAPDIDISHFPEPQTPAGADPLSDSGTITRSWASGGWQIVNGSDGNAFTSFYRWFPYADKKIHFSITGNIKVPGDEGYKLFFQTLKETAGANYLQQESTADITSAGLNRTTVTIDSTHSETLYVRCAVRTSPNSTVVITEPTLSIDRIRDFTEFYT